MRSIAKIADGALSQLEVDARGLDALDHVIFADRVKYSAGGRSGSRRSPPGCPSRATRSRKSSSPILIQQGFIARTPRGRVLTAQAFAHLGLDQPTQPATQFPLFNGSDE